VNSKRRLLAAMVGAGVSVMAGTAFMDKTRAEGAPADQEHGPLLKSGHKVAFLGASISEFGWTHPGGYIKLFVDAVIANGIAITPIPAGVSGNTSRDMLARLDTDVIAKKPDWMTVDAGGNDVWHGSVEFDAYMSNMTQIVDRAQKAGIRVALQTCTPLFEDLNGDFNKKLAYYNQFQRYLAAQRGCVLADLNQAAVDVLKTKTGMENILTTDGVHMNDRGNKVMANGLLAAFGLTTRIS